MKVLVSGGAGFIGSHTVEGLLRKGHKVRILDSFAKPVHQRGRPGYLPASVEVIEGDVRTKKDWENALEGVDAVFHLAAYQDYLTDFGKFFHVNTVGTALLYEVIVERRLPIRKVVVASSQAVYGEGKYKCLNHNCKHYDVAKYPDSRTVEQLESGLWDHRCAVCGTTLTPQPTDESRVNPQNQYALSKYTQELLAINFGRRYQIPTVALRYSIVQGPRQSFFNAYSGACRLFCLNYFFGKSPTIYEDGLQLRDFVNVEDVVAANLMMLEQSGVQYRTLNVGGDKAYTVQEFATTVRELFGADFEPKLSGQYRFGDTRHIISDITAMKKLGWAPRYSPEKSVRDYLSWLRTQADLADVLAEADRTMRMHGVVREKMKSCKE